MKINKVAASVVFMSSALGITAGTVQAAPAADAAAINYAATTSETNTVIRTDAGSLVVENDVFKIKAANGATVAGTELHFRVDEFVYPIAAEIHDRVATLTPSSTPPTPSTSRSPSPSRTRPPGRTSTNVNRPPGTA